MGNEQQLEKFSFSLPLEQEEQANAFLFLHAPWGWEEEQSQAELSFNVYFTKPHQIQDFVVNLQSNWPQVQTRQTTLDSCNWAIAWKEFFTPIQVEHTFEILPSWLSSEDENLLPIIIEPKMAFGTGHHGSTLLCLQAIARLKKQNIIKPGQTFLDLGTGSGILGIACAKLGLTGQGLDIDPVAIDNALENVELNQVEAALQLGVGGLDLLKSGQSFDLVLANILANPLIDMADALTAKIKTGGSLILSGILQEQADKVDRAYAGLGEPQIHVHQEWASLTYTAKP